MSEPKRTTLEKQAKDKVQFVRKFTKLDIISTELIVLVSTFYGGGFFVLSVLLRFPYMNLPSSLALWAFFPILLTIVTVCRNHILEWIFGKISHEGYLQFAIDWKSLPLVIIVFSVCLGLSALREPTYLLFSLTFLFLSTPLYFIFEHPLSYEGGIEVIFEGLFSSIDNFPRRQYYLKNISKTIENLLKIGEIKVSSSELTYLFNRKLLETNKDISDDLRNIRAWMLGEQKTGLDSLKRIVPEINIEPYKKDSFLKQVSQNPTPIQANLIKFLALLFVGTIALLIRPELMSQAINLAKQLLGM